MTLFVELNFCQNVLWYACRTLETKDASSKCYSFSIISDHPCDPKRVELEPYKLINQPWLYGPATDLKTKSIIYPCERFRCLIQCPCLLCEKRQPSCSSQGKCSCDECKLYMRDHQNFHATFHFGCVSCEDIIRVIPNFNFFTLDKAKKEHVRVSFDRSELKTKSTPNFSLMWKEKKALFFMGKDGDQDFWCNNCGILYWSYNDLRDHILKKHTVSKMLQHKYQKDFKCFKTTPKTTNTKCYECSSTFISVKKLHIHMESVHYGQFFACDECDETFTRKDSLYRHRVTSHRGENFVGKFECKECEGTFTRKEDLTRHQIEVHSNNDEEKFVCKDCRKQFGRRVTLKRHIKTVHLVCKYCGKQFVKKKSLEAHMRGVHECEEKEHNRCDVCDKFFVDEDDYKRHEKSIKLCRFCPEKFCTSRALGAHINSKHTFIHCEFCGQEFSKRSNLDRHLRMRTSKPKVCQVCGSVFCNYGTLSSHMIMDHHSKNMK